MKINRLPFVVFVLLFVAINSKAEFGQMTTTAISGGQGHVLALRSDGTVWAWGTNDYGQLGIGVVTNRTFPVRVGVSNVVAISAGEVHSLVVQSNGTVWAWGADGENELGNGSGTATNRPIQVPGITNAIAVAGGGYHSLALLANGQVISWGLNDYGELGIGNTNTTTNIVTVAALTNVTRIAAGEYDSMALTAAGEVWCWGYGLDGENGNGATTNVWTPVKVIASNAVDIASGAYHNLALKSDGSVWSWGYNTEGELGLGTTVNTNVPTSIPNLEPVKCISAESYNSTVTLTNGNTKVWGWLISYAPILLGKVPEFNAPSSFNKLACGFNFDSETPYFFGVPTNGTVWAWGYNDGGTFGDDNRINPQIDTFRVVPAMSFAPVPTSRWGYFTRGNLYNSDYNPLVIPIDLEQGIRLDPIGHDSYCYWNTMPWFYAIQKEILYQPDSLATGTNLARIQVENPVTAFGSQGNGSPLYINQPYRFGVYAGGFDESTTAATNVLKISVYDKTQFDGTTTNIAPINTFNIDLPRRTVSADSNAWVSFMVTNAAAKTVETNGLRTTIEFMDDGDPSDLGLVMFGSAPTNLIKTGYRITHTATTNSYFYRVEVLGKVQVATNVLAPMVTNSSGVWTPLPMYTLDFEQQPSLRPKYIDRLFFEGKPAPPTYAGSLSNEVNGLSMYPTNVYSLTNAQYLTINASPELRRHPLLDQFVSDMNKDPLALASYVINEIGLTDPYDGAESNQVVQTEINIGGVNRSALGTFLEGQGSPLEQCELLVYLLRQAGCPAAYVFPTNGSLQMLDSEISQLWQMQVKSVLMVNGAPFFVSSNGLLTVNYPWVVANVVTNGVTNTVHIFPWLKDNEIVEGVDLYDYMPTNYDSGLKWVRNYVTGDTNILSLDSKNVPSVLFPKFVQQVLATNSISLDDVGVRTFNRRRQFPTWGSLPHPNYLTNLNNLALVSSLSDSTNSFPFLVNIFDTARVEVYKDSVATTNLLLSTHDWDVCDLNNRKLLLFTNNSRLCLWMASYTTNATNIEAFTGPSSTNLQSNSVAVGTTSTLVVHSIHFRRAGKLATPAQTFPITELVGTTNDAHAIKGDVAAICMDFGRVTDKMLESQADTYWSLQRQRAANHSFAPPVWDYQGTAAYLLGMSYFKRVDKFDALNQQWHKIRNMFNFSSGLAMVGAVVSRTNFQAKVDMLFHQEMVMANGSLRPDGGVPGFTSAQNYFMLNIAETSAQEHNIIESMFPKDTSAISTVRLLQIAQQRATNGNSPVIELIRKDYVAGGNQSYGGYGSTLLKSQDTGMWNTVTNIFEQPGGDYARVLITPGKITNEVKSYIGMGALALSFGENAALISANSATLNGGFGSILDGFYDPVPTPTLSYNLTPTVDGMRFDYNNSANTVMPSLTPLDYVTVSLGGSVTLTTSQNQWGVDIANLFGGIGSAETGLQTGADSGYFGNSTAWIQNAGQVTADPVDIISGEFYVDNVDLTLPGPFPLQLRRNYLSQNLGANMFGHGWKMNLMPFLVLTTNAAHQSVIYAAELDGSVIAYHKTNNIWKVWPQDNPSLHNNVGSTTNLFNSQITTNGTTYTLKAADGSIRTYQVITSFPVTSGTNTILRSRPYLQKWQDHAGNYFTFSYGTDSSANDYGQLNRIDSANGNFLVFKYDFFGRIYQAFTGDGRFVAYEYDDYGDLITATLPDASQWQYQYEHYQTTTNGLTYTDSDHLMLQEIKPNGRIVANTYDALKRVTTQASTVGTNLVLVTNGWFFYTNNAVAGSTNRVLSGTNRVEDAFHNATTYYYTSNAITKVVDALGRTTTQNWYSDSATAPGYPRSIQSTVDRRGLTNDFYYDSFGNVTQSVVLGDITGEGNFNQSASTFFGYTTNNVLSDTTNALGAEVHLKFTNADPFLITSLIKASNGVFISTNMFFYTNVAQATPDGTATNYAFGLCWRMVLASVATNDFAFDGHGFETQVIQYPQTADATWINDGPVTNYLSYNLRGELYQKQIAGGGTTTMEYDPMSRPKSREVFDQNGVSLSRELYYYNRNGELEWSDGPRSNPEDYVYYVYDGAGRVIQVVRWRSQAKIDGSGVEAPDGYPLYSALFREYDSVGNVKRTIDARGVVTTNTWDALGELIQKQVVDTNGSFLKSQGFAYEPGGLVAYETNALLGVSQTFYTQLGKPYRHIDANGATNGWTYYLDGRTRREYRSNGAYWETSYDDLNRRATKIFYTATGTALATNISDQDRRGNVIRTVDAGGNASTNCFDGLGRLKAMWGPVISSVISGPPSPGGGGGSSTNSVQRWSTNYYDTAGLVVTNINALGEKTITYKDVLGRVTRTEIKSASNVLIRESSTSYSSDHQSVTTTEGSGGSAIVHTTYTDNDGHPVLSIAYPSAGKTEFTRSQYDLTGNLVSETHCATSGTTLNVLQTSSYVYDGLNRVIVKTNRDNAVEQYAYDAAGNLTNRSLNGVGWAAAYNNMNQMLYEYNSGTDGSITRSNSYSYFTSWPFVGLKQTQVDGRGATCTYLYDNWLRPVTNSYSGSAAEQNLTTVWQYDVRGLITNVTENFATNTTGPSTSVNKYYDAYGALTTENLYIGGTNLSTATQVTDASGRRTFLQFPQFAYWYTYQADGLLTGASGSTGGGTYSYNTAGKLLTRTFGARATSISSRDGEGRPVSVVNTVSGTTTLSETLTYTDDGLISTHTLVRPDYTDQRSYTYAPLSRRLTEEILRVSTNTIWTNAFTYDNGNGGGPGSLTYLGQLGGSGIGLKGGLDVFGRTSTETNSIALRSANGRVNGPSTVTIALDGQPMATTFNGTNPIQWFATLQLTPGAHQLVATAEHPSGQFTTNVSVTITNNAADTVASTYTGEGQTTQRTWKTAGGTTNRVQTLAWDAKGRLYKVTELDGQNSGYIWQAVYDALGRRLQTSTTVVSNNVAFTSTLVVISQFYDPTVEFLEMGVNVAGKGTWKIYGPDLNGVYGGLNGTGGFDAISTGPQMFCPTLSDMLGNVLAVYDWESYSMEWNTSRPSAYGSVPGFGPAALGFGGDIVQASAWRGRWMDITGRVNLGARSYRPDIGSFESFDPAWNAGDWNGYSFCQGDPVNFFDGSGRCRIPLTGIARVGSPYNFPGTPGTSFISLDAFNFIAGNSPRYYDDFDQSFAANIANATSLEPYGNLGIHELMIAADRGYIDPWDIPVDPVTGTDGRLLNSTTGAQAGHMLFLTLVGGVGEAAGEVGALLDGTGALSVAEPAIAVAEPAISISVPEVSAPATGASLPADMTANTVDLTAGSIRVVNPTGGTMNCVNCSLATDSTLAGSPACAMPGNPTSIGVLEQTFGGTFQSVSGPMQIGDILSSSGNGARGIVFGEALDGDVGHVWNVINRNGNIQFLDGQLGGSGLGNFNNFKNFQFLLTSPGGP